MLKSGEVIIFPTDTVYGIGCKIDDLVAQKRIYEIKKRPDNKRLAVLCASLADIEKIAVVNEDAKKVIQAFMPGGLTIILPTKTEFIGEGITDTVGVRIPNHSKALELLKINGPMATTSVNFSGETPLNEYLEIVKIFGPLVDYVYPNDFKLTEVSSTVINFTTIPYTLIREGEVSFQKVLDFLHK